MSDKIPDFSAKFKVTYNLQNAWEEWTVECEAGTTIEQIKNGRADVNFLCLNDSGNGGMDIESVEEEQ